MRSHMLPQLPRSTLLSAFEESAAGQPPVLTGVCAKRRYCVSLAVVFGCGVCLHGAVGLGTWTARWCTLVVPSGKTLVDQFAILSYIHMFNQCLTLL